MNIHFIQHEAFEAPGAYLDWAKKRNHSIRFSKVFESQALPTSAADLDLLIIMGGPQSPETSKEECPHYDAQAEIALIQKAVHAGKKVIGVCLGAQLIGEAFGAKFEHSPEKEIGVFPLEITPQGLQDEKIAAFGTELSVGHWHGDMPGLSAESKVLAKSIGCPRQIIAFTERVYAFQCHMEFTRDLVESLLAEEEDLEKDALNRFVQTPEEIRSYNYSEMNAKLFHFLDQFAAE
jgi:GMP synthase (glutamine-hydrolysing)